MMLVKENMESSGSQEFLLPAKPFQILASISKDQDIYNVGTVGTKTVFTNKNMLFSIKQRLGSFINTDMVIKSVNPKYTAIANAENFYSQLNITAVGAGSMPINITFIDTDKVIWLRCDGDYGKTFSEMPAKTTGNMPKTGFFYKLDYLLNLFHHLNGTIKFEIDAKGIMLIRSKNEVYFQLPMNEPKKQPRDTEKQSIAS